MSSSNLINYSLRQNKAIERGIVFDGMRKVFERLEISSDALYVGFGSVWFTDFYIAHRQLGVQDMVSLENDAVTAARARFNKPYRTIEVQFGDSVDLIPDLLANEGLQRRPWVAWLDFDRALDEDRLQQLDDLVRDMPDDSFLVATFSATMGQYGKPSQRLERLSTLFGFAMPDVDEELLKDQVELAAVLARATLDRLTALSIDAGREPGVPSFRLCYQDGVMMVTVGLFLPAHSETSHVVRGIVEDSAWSGLVDAPITTPPLTAQEVAALRAMLPTSTLLTRSDVVSCGFDLEDDQIESFSHHYLRYPTFAQLAF